MLVSCHAVPARINTSKGVGALSDISRWMPLVIGDHLVETAMMTPEQEGCHVRLLIHQWRHGNLPNDDRMLAQICRISLKKWLCAVRKVVLSLYRREGDSWENLSLSREREKWVSRTEKLRKSGKSAADKRWVTHAKPNAESMPYTGTGTPTPASQDGLRFAQTPQKKSLRKVKRTTEAPEGFEAFWEAYPRKKGMSRVAAATAFAKAIKIATLEQILDGVRRFPFDPEPKWQKYPETWLNQQCWNIEDNTPPATVAVAKPINGHRPTNGKADSADAYKILLGRQLPLDPPAWVSEGPTIDGEIVH